MAQHGRRRGKDRSEGQLGHYSLCPFMPKILKRKQIEERGSVGMVDKRTDDGSFLAEGLAGGIPPEVFGTGRVCIETSCTVKLSRYNSTDWCALHESPASTQRPFDTSTRQRGRRRNSTGRRRPSRKATAAAKESRQTAA
jgi:hypothetical protein